MELAGKSVDELFDILSERSGRTGQVDRKQVGDEVAYESCQPFTHKTHTTDVLAPSSSIA